MDEQLAAYLREHWDVLIRYAAVLSADPRDAAELLSRAATRVALRRRLLRRFGDDTLDRDVRRRLTRAAIAAGKAASRAPADRQLIQVSYVHESSGAAAAIGPPDRVRDALAGLPARQRAALVLSYADDLEGVGDGPAADLMGDSVTAMRTQRSKGLTALENLLGVDPAGTVTGDGSSRTEGLLRAALRETPTPASHGPDPLTVLPHRIRRLQVQLLVAVAGIAAVLAAIGTTALMNGSGGDTPAPSRLAAPMSRPPVAVPPIALPRLPLAYPSGVVVGGGYLWTLELHPSSNRSGTTIVRRDADTGRPETSYHVPAEDFVLAYGLGRVWTWGGGARPGESTVISSVDPTSGQVDSVRIKPGALIANVAFTDSDAWFTEPGPGRVLMMTAPDHVAMVTIAVRGARDVVPVSRAAVAVSGSLGVIRALPSGQLLGRGSRTLMLLAAAPSYGIWLADGQQLTYQPTINSSITVSLQPSFSVRSVIGDPSHGAYVALVGSNPDLDVPYLEYYSPAALRSLDPQPTARLDGHVLVESMAAGPNGGLVFVTNDGSIEAWNPAGRGGLAMADRSPPPLG